MLLDLVTWASEGIPLSFCISIGFPDCYELSVLLAFVFLIFEQLFPFLPHENMNNV